MTTLYRSSADPPPFGGRTLWTPEPAQARGLAEFEAAATGAPLAAQRTLWALTFLDAAECKVTLDSEVRNLLEQSVTETLPEGVFGWVAGRVCVVAIVTTRCQDAACPAPSRRATRRRGRGQHMPSGLFSMA